MNSLNFKEEKLFNFLFSKVASLQAELHLQKTFSQAIFLTLAPDEREKLELILKGLEAERQPFFENARDQIVVELQTLSDDFDTLIQNLLNQ